MSHMLALSSLEIENVTLSANISWTTHGISMQVSSELLG